MSAPITNVNTEQNEKPKATPFLEQISLRDYFAAKAMQGMLANPQQDYAPLTAMAEEAVVSSAYGIADAMLKTREV